MNKNSITKDPLYSTWQNIKTRINNPNCKEYPYYGGLGIELFDEFYDFLKFRDYIKLLPNFEKRQTKKYTLDRINSAKGYIPGNLRWASKTTQACNQHKRVINKTKYIGIYQSTRSTTYHYKLHIDGKSKYAGGFKTAEDAVKAKNAFIVANELPHTIQQL